MSQAPLAKIKAAREVKGGPEGYDHESEHKVEAVLAVRYEKDDIVFYVTWQGYSRPAPPLPAPRCRPLFSTPTSHVHCQCSSLTASRPRAGRFACCLLVWRAPQASFNILFKSSRCASTSDIINEIEGVEIDSVGIVAGRRCASLSRPSAVHPRSPARVPCIPRTLHIPRAGCAVCKPGFSRCGGGSQNFHLCSSCARRRDRRCGQWAARAVGRGEGAAARRSRRGERPGLAAVGARDGWAAWRVRRATPLSRTAARSSVGMCARERP